MYKAPQDGKNITESKFERSVIKMTDKQMKTAAGIAAGTVAMGAMRGMGIAAYNSKPMKMRRMIKRTGKTLDAVGGMLKSTASTFFKM